MPNQCLRLLACSFVMLAADARAVNDPNDLCPLSANPCQIDGIHSITDGAIFNFAGRDVILNGILNLGPGSMLLVAQTFTIAQNGRIRAQGGTTNFGGSVTIETVGDINIINSSATIAPLALNGMSGGELTLTSSEGSFTSQGKIDLSNTVIEGSGGSLEIDVAGSVNLIGKLDASGGSQGAGGDASFPIGIFAGGPVFVGTRITRPNTSNTSTGCRKRSGTSPIRCMNAPMRAAIRAVAPAC